MQNQMAINQHTQEYIYKAYFLHITYHDEPPFNLNRHTINKM